MISVSSVLLAALLLPGFAQNQDASLSEIRGHLQLPDGSPAKGVPLVLNGWESNSERVARYGLPESWTDIEARTREDGSFSIILDAPRAYQFTLDATLDGHAEIGWRWGEIPPGSTVDLGKHQFEVEGKIPADHCAICVW